MTLGSGTDVNLTETPLEVEVNVPDQPAAAMSGAKANALAAPQAFLMAKVTQGVFSGGLRWGTISIGAALASRASRCLGSARTYLVANVAAAPFILLLPLGGHGWRLILFAAGSFVALAGAMMSGVMTMTFRGNFVPAHMLGRVTAASRIFVFGSVPLGAATAGVLASALGIRAAMWILAVLYVITPLPLLATPARRLRDFPVYRQPGLGD